MKSIRTSHSRPLFALGLTALGGTALGMGVFGPWARAVDGRGWQALLTVAVFLVPASIWIIRESGAGAARRLGHALDVHARREIDRAQRKNAAREEAALLGAFAAEVTEATYLVALHQGMAASWVDLELDLWREMSNTVEKWGRNSAHTGSREDLLAELTAAAYRTTLRHGAGRSGESQTGLDRALRSVIGEKVSDFRRASA